MGPYKRSFKIIESLEIKFLKSVKFYNNQAYKKGTGVQCTTDNGNNSMIQRSRRDLDKIPR